ncbi:hypothetical protein VHEMI10182 [[Torrubiella] hemipterigena]|uniref:Extracellular matrix protein n=1 Tax=[Torrubiella] hemipterigena TaxID=1531966 RepID=A0A0A1TRH2_9HYPO|nr:hypothetical protein VHEMI10182 [[Torrubiella] hemipterigena]
MKISYLALTSLAAAATSDSDNRPHILNSDVQITEGKEFTLQFDNCPSGCTIILRKYISDQKQTDFKTLTTKTTGDSFSFTPKDIPSDTYNFYIVNNANKTLENFSDHFPYKGTATSTTTDASSSAATPIPSTTDLGDVSITMTSTRATNTGVGSSKGSPTASATAPGNGISIVGVSPLVVVAGAAAAAAAAFALF